MINISILNLKTSQDYSHNRGKWLKSIIVVEKKQLFVLFFQLIVDFQCKRRYYVFIAI